MTGNPHGSNAVIALGSNQGDREQLLRDAITAITLLDGVQVTAASTIVETLALKPAGIDPDAPSYLNAVVLVRVAGEPQNFLRQLHQIEARLGRIRQEVWGDRTIDLDLIDFDQLQINTPTITLPHPRAWQRAFVLAPWLQVQPDAVLAGRGRVADLLNATSDPVTDYPAAPLVEAVDA